MRWAFGLFLVALLVRVSPALAGEVRSFDALLSEVNALHTESYTGGLPQRNRTLAEQIRATMLEHFPAITCPPHDQMQGVVIAISDDAVRGETPANVDLQLAALLKAASSERQEVRDTAVYTIGLIGPSARDAVPFLRMRFGADTDKRIKGNWHNDAYGKVSCEAIVPPDVRQVLPDDLLPAYDPFVEFRRKVALLIAQLYLDEDVEYPPGLLSYAYENYRLAQEAETAVPLLVRILRSERLSVRKRIEAIDAVSRLPDALVPSALPALLSLASSKDEGLRESAGAALINLRHPAAIPFLIERVKRGEWAYSWQSLCHFGAEAISAEDVLLEVVQSENSWPSNARGAVEALGCIRSARAIPVFLSKLSFPDWETQVSIAKAFGSIGDARPEIVAALERLSTAHWSKIVRQAADFALGKLGLRPMQSDAEATVERVTIGGPPMNDHGLSRCDDRGRVSIDGEHWFRAGWARHELAPVPKGFPIGVADFGTREFLRVDDGWLFGSDLWHYDGKFQHVSDAGAKTELDEPGHTNLRGFVSRGGKIYAYGLQILKSGHGGVLFEVTKQANRWSSRRIAALPSPPTARASGPRGELLFRDYFSDYAVIENEVVPLKCTTDFKGKREAY